MQLEPLLKHLALQGALLAERIARILGVNCTGKKNNQAPAELVKWLDRLVVQGTLEHCDRGYRLPVSEEARQRQATAEAIRYLLATERLVSASRLNTLGTLALEIARVLDDVTSISVDDTQYFELVEEEVAA